MFGWWPFRRDRPSDDSRRPSTALGSDVVGSTIIRFKVIDIYNDRRFNTNATPETANIEVKNINDKNEVVKKLTNYIASRENPIQLNNQYVNTEQHDAKKVSNDHAIQHIYSKFISGADIMIYPQIIQGRAIGNYVRILPLISNNRLGVHISDVDDTSSSGSATNTTNTSITTDGINTVEDDEGGPAFTSVVPILTSGPAKVKVRRVHARAPLPDDYALPGHVPSPYGDPPWLHP